MKEKILNVQKVQFFFKSDKIQAQGIGLSAKSDQITPTHPNHSTVISLFYTDLDDIFCVNDLTCM